MTQALSWGAVDLLPSDAKIDALGYMIEASADGTTWGNPEAIINAVQSRLQDGSLAIVDSYDNREPQLYLRVVADTYDGLEAAETALTAETELDGYGTLTWTPSVEFAEATVFDVITATLNHDFDDLAELDLERYYVANLSCLPFPRSGAEVVTSALTPPPSTPVDTQVDNGSSATGWAGSPGNAASVGGAVQAVATYSVVDSGDSTTGWTNSSTHPDGAPFTFQSQIGVAQPVVAGEYIGATRTATFSTTSGMVYIGIDVLANAGATVEVFLNGSGLPATILAYGGTPRSGFTRLWVQSPGSSITSIVIRYRSFGGPTYLWIDQIILTNVNPATPYLSLTRTGSITGLATTPYLTIDYAVSQSGVAQVNTPVEVFLDGAAASILATTTVGAYKRLYVRAPGSSVNTVQLRMNPTPWSVTTTIAIDQVRKTDAGPAIGSRRQLLRTLHVQGTRRTQGRLAIEHETTSLGEVLVYTYKDDGSGYVPPLRPWWFAGSAVDTSDATTVSGGTNMLDTLQDYRIPASMIVPGNHHLYARLKGNSAGAVTLTVTSSVMVGSNTLPGTFTTSITLTVATSYAIFDLGSIPVPATLLPDGTTATVRVTIVDADTAGIDVTLDEAWLFNVDIGALNHVDCGAGAAAAGGPSKRLWFDPATVTNDGQDAVFRGHSADRTDAFNPADSIKGYTPPQFDPGDLSVFTVTTNVIDAAVSARYYRRYSHHVGKVAA